MSRFFGGIVGAIQGAVVGLLTSLAVGHFEVLFPYDIIAACALCCAVVGFVFGEQVVDFFTDVTHNILDFMPHDPN